MRRADGGGHDEHKDHKDHEARRLVSTLAPWQMQAGPSGPEFTVSTHAGSEDPGYIHV